MLPPRLFHASLMVLGLATLAVGADRDTKPADKKAEPKSRPGWIVVEEDVWIRLNDEPSLHMRQAHESFVKKDYGATTRDLRKAAGYLHIAAPKRLQRDQGSTHCFRARVGNLGGGRPSRHCEIGQELGFRLRTGRACVRGRRSRQGQTALNAKHPARAGHYLRSAVNHVRDAAKWSGHELERGTVATANDVRLVAGKLIDGSGVVVDEAEKGITWVGDEVEKVGRAID